MATPEEKSPEAVQHVEETGHSVDHSDDCELWACFDCPWVDSNFLPLIELNKETQ